MGIIASRDYSLMRVIGGSRYGIWKLESALVRTVLECRLIRSGYVSLHASALEVDGCAYAFCGASGAGKSTRARAWIDGLSARMISGDRPLLHVDTLELYGVPWDGKEQCFQNTHAPLKVLFDLRRSRTCFLRSMTFEQRRRMLMRQCFLPMWDTDSAVLQMRNIARLASNAQILRSFSGPSPSDAVALYRMFDSLTVLEEKKDMKAKSGFIMREIAGENILMPVDENINKFSGTLLMNGVSAFVWEKLSAPISREDLLTAILDEYEVDRETASADLDRLLARLEELNVIETEN